MSDENTPPSLRPERPNLKGFMLPKIRQHHSPSETRPDKRSRHIFTPVSGLGISRILNRGQSHADFSSDKGSDKPQGILPSAGKTERTIVELQGRRQPLRPIRKSLKADSERKSKNMFDPGARSSFGEAASLNPASSKDRGRIQKPPMDITHILPEPVKSSENKALETNLEKALEQEFSKAMQEKGSAFRKFPGVPISEELQHTPEAIQEYCEREPVLLTDRASLKGSPKFGTIPARFKAETLKIKEQMDIIDIARAYVSEDDTIEGVSLTIDMGTMEGRKKSRIINALCSRLENGDDLSVEYAALKAQYNIFKSASDQAHAIYHTQIQEIFVTMAHSMTRRQIGDFAQMTWLKNFRPHEQDNFNSSFFNDDLRRADKTVRECAQKGALAALKWISLVINEMPVNRRTMDQKPSANFKPELFRDHPDPDYQP